MAIFEPRQSARNLRETGLDEPVADAIVEVAEEVARDADEALKEATGELVTKEYLDARLGEFRAEMRAFEERMRAEFEKQRAEMYHGQNRLMILTFGMATALALIAIGVVQLT